MLMDISSEMIHALLPIYLVTAFGASALTVGVIEGIAEATASITKIFSGALSDWLGRRKALAALGYGLAAFTKPVFPLATSLAAVIAARFIDRVGKGIRGAPRDALVADLAPPAHRGASFGLRQALDTVGAFVGPFVAVGLMAVWGSVQLVFWVAVIPAFLSFLLIVFAVKEPQRPDGQRVVKMPLGLSELRRLGRTYWLVVAIAALFTLARFSEAFLTLRAAELGTPMALVPLVLVVMNVVYALSAYPAGALSDRMERTQLLGLGMIVLILADLALGVLPGLVGLGLGIALWGLHMGLTQGLFAAMIADSAPAELRGTAYGLFNLVSGIAMLLASLVAGALWDGAGSSLTFTMGAVFAALSLGALLLAGRHLRAQPGS
jgi:MFS family permease